MGLPQELTKEDWSVLYPALRRHARRRMARFRWRRAFGPDCAEDLLLVSVEKVLDGRRRWNREEYLDFAAFLRSVVDSEIHHLAVSLENRCMEERFEWEPPDEHTPETLMIRGQEPQAEFLPELRRKLGEDAEALRVLSSFERQAEARAVVKPGSVQGLPVSSVRNAMKRIRRRALELRQAG